MNVLGIDFGMENIKVAYYNGKTTQIVNIDSNQTEELTPNVVYYEEDEETGELKKYFGNNQKTLSGKKMGSENYIRHIKQKLYSDTKNKIELCNGKYKLDTEEIITDIFKNIYDNTIKEIREIGEIVLTVPVIFSEKQKNCLKRCAENAGFNVSEIITEPFAALFSSEIDVQNIECDDETYIVIFDFGGSTLDICLAQLENQNNEKNLILKASAGLKFGGNDISEIILNNIVKPELEKHTEEFLQRCGNSQTVLDFRFKELADELKIDLFNDEDNVEGEANLFGENVEITKEKMETLLDKCGIKQKIIELLDNIFEDDYEGVEKEDISYVFTIGGTSKIPYFRKLLETYFDKEPEGDIEEDEYIYNSVALGAAAYFAEKDNINISMTLPISVGIDRGRGFETVLDKNTFFSAEGPIKKYTIQELEKNNWKINVYQSLSGKRGESVNSEDVVYTGKFILNKRTYDKGRDVYLRVSQNINGIKAEMLQPDEKNDFVVAEIVELETEE